MEVVATSNSSESIESLIHFLKCSEIEKSMSLQKFPSIFFYLKNLFFSILSMSFENFISIFYALTTGYYQLSHVKNRNKEMNLNEGTEHGHTQNEIRLVNY